MPDNRQVNESESIWFMKRCEFCWREVRSDQVIEVRGEEFCSSHCAAEYFRPMKEPEA